jgi:hypothetical protein
MNAKIQSLTRFSLKTRPHHRPSTWPDVERNQAGLEFFFILAGNALRPFRLSFRLTDRYADILEKGHDHDASKNRRQSED